MVDGRRQGVQRGRFTRVRSVVRQARRGFERATRARGERAQASGEDYDLVPVANHIQTSRRASRDFFERHRGEDEADHGRRGVLAHEGAERTLDRRHHRPGREQGHRDVGPTSRLVTLANRRTRRAFRWMD